MEIVSNIGRTLNDFAFSGSQRVASRDLDQQDFLKLMLEQLRNQNPLEPQDNSQFFSQMAQFNTLETMREMATSLRSLAARPAASGSRWGSCAATPRATAASCSSFMSSPGVRSSASRGSMGAARS